MLLLWFITSVDIFHQLPKNSVSRLSQTCKHLAEVLETALYADLDLQLSQTWFETNGLEQLLATDPSGIQRTSTLTIAIAEKSLDDVYNSEPIDDGERYYPEDTPTKRLVLEFSDMGKCSYSRFFKLATLVQLLIQKLPKQSLRCFRYVTYILCLKLWGNTDMFTDIRTCVQKPAPISQYQYVERS